MPGESVIPAIAPTAVFHLPGDPADAPYQYGRFSNPTWEALEGALGLLEGAETLVFPSGMAAIAAVLFSHLAAGDRVLIPSDGYYTTRVLGEKYLQALGVNIETRPTAQFLNGGFEGFRFVLLETPSNPGLDVCDLRSAAALAKQAGALFVVDNTTMTPLGQRPLEHGADAVVCADTKAINGHSDALLGHVASRDQALLTKVRDWRRYAGAIASPFEAWLVFRGLETLELRFSRMCSTAAIVAERLAAHPAVQSVRYPGLRSDPSHSIAASQMATFGSMISLTLQDSAAAEAFMANCRYLQPSTSFGGVRTCAERRARWGDAVPEGFVRLSIGVEPIEALWDALDEALSQA